MAGGGERRGGGVGEASGGGDTATAPLDWICYRTTTTTAAAAPEQWMGGVVGKRPTAHSGIGMG
jgi:hypothetical protein